MDQAEMQERTKAFALRILKVADTLPRTTAASVIGNQLVRSGTSVASNYRAVRRARSHADFLNKLGVVEEEADETGFWLEMLADAGIVRESRLKDLRAECNEITAIIVPMIKTAKHHRK